LLCIDDLRQGIQRGDGVSFVVTNKRRKRRKNTKIVQHLSFLDQQLKRPSAPQQTLYSSDSVVNGGSGLNHTTAASSPNDEIYLNMLYLYDLDTFGTNSHKVFPTTTDSGFDQSWQTLVTDYGISPFGTNF